MSEFFGLLIINNTYESFYLIYIPKGLVVQKLLRFSKNNIHLFVIL